MCLTDNLEIRNDKMNGRKRKRTAMDDTKDHKESPEDDITI